MSSIVKLQRCLFLKFFIAHIKKHKKKLIMLKHIDCVQFVEKSMHAVGLGSAFQLFIWLRMQF